MAKVISYIFHPIFAPLLAMILIFNLPIYINYKYTQMYFIYIYVILFINLIAAPLLISMYLKRIGLINSLQMSTVEERKMPYMISSIFYGFTYFLLAKIGFPDDYLLLFGAASITVLALFILSLFNIKISAHLAGLGGICGMLIILSVYAAVDLSNWLIVFILISGLVGAARLSLSAHKAWEILLGFSLGIGTQLYLLY